MPKSLSEHIRGKVAEWVKDKSLNPAHCKIEVHSIYPSKKIPGEFDISFDIAYSYAVWIQALLTPFYIIFSLFSIIEGVEYLEDIAYFKRFTPRGIRKKREVMEQTRLRFMDLIVKECHSYNNGEDTNNG